MDAVLFVRAAVACQMCQKASNPKMAYMFIKEMGEALLALLIKAQKEGVSAQGTELEISCSEMFHELLEAINEYSSLCCLCDRASPKVANKLERWIKVFQNQQDCSFSPPCIEASCVGVGARSGGNSRVVLFDLRRKKRI